MTSPQFPAGRPGEAPVAATGVAATGVAATGVAAIGAAVIGGGPAGLMAAEVLSRAGVSVAVFDRMPSVGRKFMMAGRGGLNLTHGEALETFLDRYGAARARLEPAIRAFDPAALIAWCEGLGQPTFIGTSGRVFPRAMKASPLLRAWLGRLAAAGARFFPRHRFAGFDGADPLFETPEGSRKIHAGATVLALGGASWPRLGSDGGWPSLLADCAISPLRPANCGFVVDWSDHLRRVAAGAPLKRIALSAGGRTVRGEAVIAEAGIEGGAVYALSAWLRETIAAEGRAVLEIDLRPDLSPAELSRRLGADRRANSLSTFLRKAAGLSPAAVALIQEALHREGETRPLAEIVKKLPIELTAPFPIARAISTAGGLSFSEIDDDFMLTRRPGVFVAGEMLDWEAPTGGYLLQACMATGAAAGRGAARWIAGRGAVEACLDAERSGPP